MMPRKFTLLMLSLVLVGWVLGFTSEASEPASFFTTDVEALIRRARSTNLASETGALILVYEKQLVAGPRGDTELKVHVCGLISDEKAASDYSQISLYFNAFYEEARLDFARSIQENGERLNASPDAIQIRTVSQPGQTKMYTDMKTLTFSIPALRPGAAFEFMATYKARPIVGTKWTKTLNFNFTLYSSGPTPRVDPVLQSRISVFTPLDKEIKIHPHLVTIQPRVARTAGGLNHLWEMTHVPGLIYEANMPVDDFLLPSVACSSILDWKEIDQWAHGLFAPNYQFSDAVQKAALQAASGKTDRRGKIRAVYQFIQKNIEYIEADLGRGGYQPHPSDQVLKNGYGDCKDQTVLFVSMLKALGIEAYPAILTTFPWKENHDNLPTPFFNHAITYVPHPEGDLWLDTVAASNKFPNLPYHDRDRSAFIIDGQGGGFKKTTARGSESDVGEINFNFKASNETLFINMTLIGRGAMSDMNKHTFKALTPEQRNTTLQTFLKGMFPKCEVQNVGFSDLGNPDIPFKATASSRILQAIAPESGATILPFSFLPAMEYFSNLNTLVPPADRKSDYVMGLCYDIESRYTYDMTEKGFAGLNLPQNEVVDTEFFRYECRYEDKERSLTATAKLKVKKAVIPLSRYPEFYSGIQKVLQVSNNNLTFQKRELDVAAQTFETTLNEKPEDVASLVGLAKQYLKSGKYTEASGLLGKAITLDPNNGESHYFMGIALGHESKTDEAQKEFETANRLGFLP